MPEFVEAEAYRRTLDPVIGAAIDAVDIPDQRILRRNDDEGDLVRGVLTGAKIVGTRRIGKAVLTDVSSGHTLALAFGLRGRLLLDGGTSDAAGHWREKPARPDHVRFRMRLGDHEVELEDQLRLATIEIDVDESKFGIDIMALEKRELRSLLGLSDAAIKSVLMNQTRIAGIGNLIADEMLYQGGIDPRRPASDISGNDLDDLWTGVRRTRDRVLERNGSHHGVLIQSGARERGASCPRCGVEIKRITVGGRTSYFCPDHQR